MAKIPDSIVAIIKKFVEYANEDNIHISEAVLFGSYAKGTNHEWSDIDNAIVSEDFEGVRIFDNKKIQKAKLKTSIDLETHPYRPEEFTTDNPFVKEILEYGVRIV